MTRAALAALLLCAASAVAHAGDPTRVYRTVETEHFVIYYWVPMDDVARRVGVVAERAHRNLTTALDHLPTDKTIIVLSDDTDDANGFAGVLPRNAIQLYATGPGSFSELDDHEDWLYGLVAHEYTHIIHLDTMSGLPNIYNSIFGKTWAPNQVLPRWIIEGIAVYEESKRSSGGRDRGTRFDEFIRIARHAGKDLRLDEVSGAPRQFPRGNAAYVYGSHFLKYIFDRFGDDTARKMGHESGGYPIPFSVNRSIAKVVGKPFTELYGDWKNYLRDRYGMQEMAAERRGLRDGRALTHTAEGNSWPHYSADGKELIWVQYDGYTVPTVRAMPVGGTMDQARDVVQIDSMGPFDLLRDGSLVYEQGRQVRLVYAFEDLFYWDAGKQQSIRLTQAARARDPAVSPDGRQIAFSMNEHSTSVLAITALTPDAPISVAWRGARYDQAYQPAWSPDGTKIAFSAWKEHGLRDILVVEVASGQVTEITHDRAIDMSPSWSADGRYLFFDSDRSSISNIYAYDLVQRSLWQVTNVLGGAFHARPSPDGKRIAFESGVAAGGFDLYELPLDRAQWLPAYDAVDSRPPPVNVRDDEVGVSAPRPYRPLETLAPQTWTLAYNLSALSNATIQTGGGDAFGLHAYSVAISTDLDHGDANVGVSYGYAGFRPTLRISGARTLAHRNGYKIDGVAKTFEEEDWAGTVSASIPFESRPSSSWALSFDYDFDWYRLTNPPKYTPDPNQLTPVVPLTNYLQAGVGVRMSFSNVRGATFALGATDGFDASVSLRLDHPDFGSDYRDLTLSYATDYYRKLWGKTPVLAARLTGAFREGDLFRDGGFALGGVPAQDVAMAIVNSTRVGVTGYLRGYPTRTVTGNQYHLLNLEYRQELFQIEHGLELLPIYLRRVHVGVLSDTGTAFDDQFDVHKHLRSSLGAALRIDAFFGYFVPGTFEIGYSHGLTSEGISQTWLLLTGSL